MKITYLSDGAVTVNEQKALWCQLASVRLRGLIPLLNIKRTKQNITLNFLKADALTKEDWNDETKFGDVVVVGKLFTNCTNHLHYLKGKGKRIIVDFCDNHFDNGDYGEHYLELLGLADNVVVSTPALAGIVKEFGYVATVISDPLDQKLVEPQYNIGNGDMIKSIWFGHAINLDPLVTYMGQLKKLASTEDFLLLVLTNKGPNFTTLGKIATDNNVKLKALVWDDAVCAECLTEADFAFLPVYNRGNWIYKSPNRVIKAIANGILPLTNYIHADAKLAEMLEVTPNLEEGADNLMAMSYEDYLEKVRYLQIYIQREYSEQVISDKWYGVING